MARGFLEAAAAVVYDAAVQLPLPGLRARPSRSARRPALVVAGRVFPVIVARHRRARRYLLRLTDEGGVRLTVPRGASLSAGLRFAETQAAWIAEQWARLRARAMWGPGTEVWYRGVETPLVVEATSVRLGDLIIARDPGEDLRACVHRRLRDLAAVELPERCRAAAAECRLEPERISVRDQRSRWGACSSRRTITLNWRLVQMPPEVADYVIRHELAHLLHPNHSRRFWRAVAGICPGWREAERWLRRHGRELL